MAQVLIVEARFYEHLNDQLLSGARAAIEEAGHSRDDHRARRTGDSRRGGAGGGHGPLRRLVAIGVVIRGETYHFEIVSNESARGLMALTMDGLPIGNGIITTENEAQALTRAKPTEKNKGGEAAKALAMLALKGRFG
jgi:6,7-dimethyl-8-ribityllumazine synthase